MTLVINPRFNPRPMNLLRARRIKGGCCATVCTAQSIDIIGQFFVWQKIPVRAAWSVLNAKTTLGNAVLMNVSAFLCLSYELVHFTIQLCCMISNVKRRWTIIWAQSHQIIRAEHIVWSHPQNVFLDVTTSESNYNHRLGLCAINMDDIVWHDIYIEFSAQPQKHNP